MDAFSNELRLPTRSGRMEAFRLGEPSPFPAKRAGPFNRVAFAAAHVVADARAATDPWLTPAIDWDATLAYRRHLWSYGLAVAEAMDTAQRGMGLDWVASQELIRRSLDEARAARGVIACGAGTDHLAPGDSVTLEDVERAYE